MEIHSQIETWCSQLLPENLFLVQLEQKPDGKKLIVYIDGDNGIGINDCKTLSKQLSEKLDALEFGNEPYMLEVSSPGADKPLLKVRQYHKHVGRELLVKLTAKTEISGKLQSVTDNTIVLALKDKKKGYQPENVKEIAFNEIEEATIILSFK